MENAMMLASIFGPIYVVMGLSLLLYSSAWQKVMKLYSENHYQMMAMMVFNLFIGMVIITMYNVWEWNLYLIITLTGWGAFLKGVAYFLLPGDTFKGMMKTCNNSGFIMFGGLVVTVAGAALCYYSYMV